MENNLFGVIIKVENLDISRSFYRDILDLGSPVIDSNFWVEFRLPGDFSLVLEKKAEDEKIPETLGRISWMYKVKDIGEILKRLKEYGYEAIVEEGQRIGYKTYIFCDPEGNPFYLCSAKDDDKDLIPEV
jgi:predicted enzyme related to lactoylglutathione lyase